MTDFPVRENDGIRKLDFTGVQVTGLVGGGGVTSINGDPTPAQTLVNSYGIGITDAGGGEHDIAVKLATGVLVDGGLGFDGTGGLQIEAAAPLFIDSTTPPFGGTGKLLCLTQFGIQVDPGSNPGALSLDGSNTMRRYSTSAIVNGQNDNVSLILPGPPSYTCGHIQASVPTADYSITGFDYTFTDGRTLVIHYENRTAFTCTFKNLNAGSSPINQISLPGGDLIASRGSIFSFLYDTLDQKWKSLS